MAAIKKYNGSTWETTTARKYETATETIQSGDTIYADGTVATVSLKGNTVQNGTPSSSNPVDVQGVGNKTANLFDVNGETDSISASVTIINNGIKFENVPSGNTAKIIYSAQYAAGTYNISCVASGSNYYTARIFSDSSFTGATYNSYYGGYYRDFTASGFSTSLTFDNDFKIGFIANAASGATFTIYDIMLSTTEADYEPYGYKIPISSANTTTPVYLGEAETTRKIKKLVLTGEETITFASEDDNRMVGFFAIPGMGMKSSKTGYCNILQWKSSYSQSEYNRIMAHGSARFYMSIAKSALPEPTFEGFIAYLAAQYAAGTPVTIWYVLAEPETAVVNEPLMKIGDYADSISNAASIPTTEGANSISVDTTVQPSEFTATWTGWHDASVKEWDGSQWNE